MQATGSKPTTTVRDKFWRGAPWSIVAFAALGRDGNIMANSIRARPEDVRLACGNDCVPIRVRVAWEPEAMPEPHHD